MKKNRRNYREKRHSLLGSITDKSGVSGDTSTLSFFENLAQGISVKQFSHDSRIPAKTIYDWIYKDHLPDDCILRINGRIRLIRRAVEAWLLSQQSFARN